MRENEYGPLMNTDERGFDDLFSIRVYPRSSAAIYQKRNL
jgi:hypothetical protein